MLAWLLNANEQKNIKNIKRHLRGFAKQGKTKQTLNTQIGSIPVKLFT